jgi:hypothetical protein
VKPSGFTPIPFCVQRRLFLLLLLRLFVRSILFFDRLYFLHCLLIQRRHGGAYRFLSDQACATVELPEVAWGMKKKKTGH